MYGWGEAALTRFTPVNKSITRSPRPVENALLVSTAADEGSDYNFKSPSAAQFHHFEREFISALAETRAFKRLSHIRFLGALDYFIISNPNGLPQNSRFSRAQHSFGVATLAQAYLNLREHSTHARLVCLAAALLHDIGHTPFSHTLEPLFQERFGLDHHKISEEMILGKDKEFEDIKKVLEIFSVDPAEVVEILSGNDTEFDEFFSGPINFDTIEGILRSRQYIKMSSMGLHPTRVVEAATLRLAAADAQIVDSFWLAKHDMYNVVIRSAYGAMLDLIFKHIVLSYDNISPNDFYLTDVQAFRKFPNLRSALNFNEFDRLRERLVGNEIDVNVRTFFVDQSVPFSSRKDVKRYRQSKKRKTLTLPKLKAFSRERPSEEVNEIDKRCTDLF